MSSVRRRGHTSEGGIPYSVAKGACGDDEGIGNKEKIISPWASSLFLYVLLSAGLLAGGVFLWPKPSPRGGFSQLVKEQSKFLLPDLPPGAIERFVWKEDGKVADTHGRLIGLPPELTDEIRRYTKEIGLYKVFQDLLYDRENKLAPGEQRLIANLAGNRKWAAMTPGTIGNWKKSDLHWVDVADEINFEDTLQVLKRGNFDLVLDAIGNEFDVDGLMIGGMGFILTSHTKRGNMHQDLPGSGGVWWDLLFPLVLPEKEFSGVYIGDEDDDDRKERVPFTPDVGILLGDTSHGTTPCDFRGTGEYRVAVSIYIIDINEENAQMVAGDGTALFPIPDEPNWYLSQKGRSWGNGNSLEFDVGRRPYQPQDTREDCAELAEEGLCEEDLKGIRAECLKSCNIFIDDSVYFGELLPALQKK